MIKIEEIKQLIKDGKIACCQTDVVAVGEIVSDDDLIHEYKLHHGWDIAKCQVCDTEWGKFNFALMEFINQTYKGAELAKVLESIQMDDGHWDWFKKAYLKTGEEYNWFFFCVDEIPQAACLIFHPKKSALHDGKIFYIEYVAVAPWNRVNPMVSRKFKGIASIVIRYAINYAKNTLNLAYGFSLHSLPKAEEYYEKIGMTRQAHLDDGQLPYFEMNVARAISFLEDA
jgi:hypothetical protein